eukprot:8510830-Ditylum_brightwellii.AAC.1
MIANSKKFDSHHMFHTSKVRATVSYDTCGAERVIYSDHMVGSKNGPSQDHLDNLLALLENGYICGNSINEESGFYVRQALRCGDFIEPQYYNSKKGIQGGRIVTEDICAICYKKDNIVSADEIRAKRDIGGKNPLLVCRFCFDSNVEIPCSAGQTNMKEQKDQKRCTKRKQLDDSVASGCRKGHTVGSSGAQE